MERQAIRQQPTPAPITPKVGLKQPAERQPTKLQHTPAPPATPKIELKQPSITENDLRLRAYEIYLERGSNPGSELDDWLQAERELKARFSLL